MKARNLPGIAFDKYRYHTNNQKSVCWIYIIYAHVEEYINEKKLQMIHSFIIAYTVYSNHQCNMAFQNFNIDNK